MFVASWSFDMKVGTRDEVVKMLKEFEANPPGAGWKAKRTRALIGSIGAPETRVVVEHEFESLADLEASWDSMHKDPERFRKMGAQLKNVVVDGTPRWEIYRIVAGA